jgi:hypothetical protein
VAVAEQQFGALDGQPASSRHANRPQVALHVTVLSSAQH